MYVHGICRDRAQRRRRRIETLNIGEIMPIIMFAKGFSFRQACAYVLINQILTNIK